MDPEDADAPLEARPPLLEDLVSLCRDLNREGARYVVLGGMAVIQAGFVRATNDVDLLIDTSPENQERVRRALMALPDGAVRDLAPDDLDRYVVVRVADEFVVDLMKSACGIDYAEASRLVDVVCDPGRQHPLREPAAAVADEADAARQGQGGPCLSRPLAREPGRDGRLREDQASPKAAQRRLRCARATGNTRFTGASRATSQSASVSRRRISAIRPTLTA